MKSLEEYVKKLNHTLIPALLLLKSTLLHYLATQCSNSDKIYEPVEYDNAVEQKHSQAVKMMSKNKHMTFKTKLSKREETKEKD